MRDIVNRQAIPCPPEMRERCPIFELEGECYEDKHHLYWPSSDYNGRVDKEFRQLEVNKMDICRWLHNTLHAVALPPEKPTRSVMTGVINHERTRRS